MSNHTNEKTIHVRLKEGDARKLEQLQKDTGKNLSSIIRDLINHDQVITYIDGKERVQAIAETQRSFNLYNHKMMHCLNATKLLTQNCEIALRDRNISSEAVKINLMNMFSFIEQLKLDYERQKEHYSVLLDRQVD